MQQKVPGVVGTFSNMAKSNKKMLIMGFKTRSTDQKLPPIARSASAEYEEKLNLFYTSIQDFKLSTTLEVYCGQ